MKKLSGVLLINADFGFGNDDGLPDGQFPVGHTVELPETIALDWSIQGLIDLRSKKAKQETAKEAQKQQRDNSPVTPEEKVIPSGEGDGSIPQENQQKIKTS